MGNWSGSWGRGRTRGVGKQKCFSIGRLRGGQDLSSVSLSFIWEGGFFFSIVRWASVSLCYQLFWEPHQWMMSQLEGKEKEGKEKQVWKKKSSLPSAPPTTPSSHRPVEPKRAGKVGNFRNLEQNHQLSPWDRQWVPGWTDLSLNPLAPSISWEVEKKKGQWQGRGPKAR